MTGLIYKLRTFFTNTGGNVATIFAISLVPILGAVGAAYDYSNMELIKSRMQNAADASVLVAAIESTLTENERTKKAEKFYNSNFANLNITNFDITYKDESVTLNVEAELPTSFLGMVGYNKFPINVMARSNQDQARVEVALVLDISGSMRSTLSGGGIRMDELKKAAGLLIDEVETAGPARSKFAIIPFTMNVNIGTKNKHMVTGRGSKYFTGTKWMGCVQELAAPNHISNSPNRKFPAYIWPPAPNSTSAGGCKNPSDGTNKKYKYLAEVDSVLAANKYNANLDGPNRNCVRHEILPLSDNINKVKKYLNGLTSEGNDGTIIAPGVTWGLRALSPEKPFTEGDSWNKNTYKYMMVLTDGEQTTEIESQSQTCQREKNTIDNYKFSPSKRRMGGKTLKKFGPMDNWTPYGYIADSDPFSTGIRNISQLPDNLEKLSLSACTEAKKSYDGKEIEIFTIGISDATAPGTRAYDLLNKCATKPANHYYVNDSASLKAAFKAIAINVKNIRLTH